MQSVTTLARLKRPGKIAGTVKGVLAKTNIALWTSTIMISYVVIVIVVVVVVVFDVSVVRRRLRRLRRQTRDALIAHLDT